MNLIDAWLKANEGQTLTCNFKVNNEPANRQIKKETAKKLRGWLSVLWTEEILSEHWEIVKKKEKKKIVIEDVMRCARGLLDNNSDNIMDRLPGDGISLKITVEWEK